MILPRFSNQTIRISIFVLVFFVAAATASAQQDTTPPVLLDYSFSPSAIDTTNSSQDVTFTAHITDDLGGLSQACFSFYSPSQTQSRGACFGWWNRIQGNELDGIYQT
ncbi:MAG: hypothetical protein HYR58_05580, partial [Acidobacteria bacterium]|nr:hypothetical protein [Acidobacteriota bacterium]